MLSGQKLANTFAHITTLEKNQQELNDIFIDLNIESVKDHDIIKQNECQLQLKTKKQKLCKIQCPSQTHKVRKWNVELIMYEIPSGR